MLKLVCRVLVTKLIFRHWSLVGLFSLLGPVMGFAQIDEAGETAEVEMVEEEVSDSETSYDIEDPYKRLLRLEPWVQPKYQAHPAFKVPDPLKVSFEFWKKIYAETPSDQGVIHDTEDLRIIYAKLDFSAINRRSDIHRFRKEHLRQKMVQEHKKKVIAALTKLKKMKSLVQLNDFEKEIYDCCFEFIEKRSLKSLTKNVRFQLGQKDKVLRAIFYSGLYLKDFEKLFAQNELPIELTRLPFVESSYNPMARSKVGASGLWQLMPSVLNRKEKKFVSIDLRNFPWTAAEIAARVLTQNYRMLKRWDLAVVAYNHGPSGVQRLTKQCRSQNIWDLMDAGRCRGKRLGFASRNFLPSFLAVLEIERNAQFYFGSVYRAKPLIGQIVKLNKPTKIGDILKEFDGNLALLELYNPHLSWKASKGLMPIEKGAPLMFPSKRGTADE